VPTEFADHQRKAMLRAIHERESRWDEVDPDTEVALIGEGIGLSEDQSYELFGHLVDEGLELARIGSLLFIFADSPSYQTCTLSSIDTFATRISAQALSRSKSCLSSRRRDAG
jgi:hypothetical protein